MYAIRVWTPGLEPFTFASTDNPIIAGWHAQDAQDWYPDADRIATFLDDRLYSTRIDRAYIVQEQARMLGCV